ncbi:flippase [Chloroflexota bacterium]
MINELFKDISKYLPSMLVPAIVGIIVLPVLTRLFPPADFGLYSLVMATIHILTTFVGWLSISIIRFFPAYERDNTLKEIYSSVVKLLFISVVLLAGVFLGFLFIFKSYILPQLWPLMLIGVAIFILTSGFQVLQSFLRARRQISWYSGFSIWNSVATLCFGIALVMSFSYGVEGLLWGNVLSLAVVVPLLWMIAVRGKTDLRASGISVELTKDMAKFGLPMVVGSLAAWVLSLSDRYVLEFYRGAQEVGIYSVSYNISENSIFLLVSLFILASGPLNIRIWERDGIEKSQQFATKVTRYFLLLCLPAAVGLSILAKPAIAVLAAPEYYEGYRIVALVAFGYFFLGLEHRFGVGFVFYKKTIHIMIIFVISVLMNIGLNLWLVPHYGYMAAAVTTLVSYAFLLVVTIVISRRYFIWGFPFKSLGKIVVASAIMGLAVYPVGNGLTSSSHINLILGICVGVAVYVLMIFLLRELQKEEIHALRGIGRRILKRGQDK